MHCVDRKIVCIFIFKMVDLGRYLLIGYLDPWECLLFRAYIAIQVSKLAANSEKLHGRWTLGTCY